MRRIFALCGVTALLSLSSNIIATAEEKAMASAPEQTTIKNRDYYGQKLFSEPIIPDVTKYRVLVEPPNNEEWSWAGAPSVLRDAKGTIWLTYRLRTKDERGGSVVIAKSTDGYKFSEVKVFRKEEFQAKSLERAMLRINPWTGKFQLYMSPDNEVRQPGSSGVSEGGYQRGLGGWCIEKLEDVDDPSQFDAKTSHVVLWPLGYGSDSKAIKDPFVFRLGRVLHMTYIGNSGRAELPHLATSVDGDHWKRFENNPVLDSIGWHDFYTRIACVMPLSHGFAIFYEGSNKDDYEPVFDIQTGLAFSLDLKEFVDLTPSAPLLTSPTPGKSKTLRYIDYLVLPDRVLFYYEAARPNDSNELRVSEVKL